MKRVLSPIFGIILAAQIFAQTPVNVQKGGAAGTNNITADLNIATGRTLTIATGGIETLASGGTYNLLSGATFNVGTTTPAKVSGNSGAFTVTGAGTGDITMTSGTTGAINLNAANTAATVFINGTGTGGGGIRFRISGTDTGFAGTSGLWLGSAATNLAIAAIANFDVYTNNSATISARVSTAGNLLLGGSTNGTGQLQLLGTGGTAASGITFATDINLFRSSAGVIDVSVAAGSPTFRFLNGATFRGFIGTSGATLTVNSQSGAIVFESANSAAVTLSTAQLVRFNAYGAGAITSDASGNLTAVSDARKKDIAADFTRGLKEILQLNPKTYHWKKDSGLDPSTLNAGFIAQEVLPIIPEAIGQGPDGFYTFADRPITAALVNATKELDERTRAPHDWPARGMAAGAIVLLVANLVISRKPKPSRPMNK